jgi:hypothetical protein
MPPTTRPGVSFATIGPMLLLYRGLPSIFFVIFHKPFFIFFYI